MIYRKLIIIVLILIVVLSLAGCSNFKINTTISGKTLFIEKNQYYLEGDNSKTIINITKGSGKFHIVKAIQNKDKTAIAFVIIPNEKNNWVKPWEIERYVILVSKDIILFNQKYDNNVLLKWKDSQNLIVFPYKELQILKENKVIVRALKKGYWDLNQFK